MPLWDHVVVPQQHAIEGMRRSHQTVSVRGHDDLVDQLVDGSILDADQVATALPVGSLRAPEIALLVTRRHRLRKTADNDVIVEHVATTLVLRGVNDAHADLDAELFQRRLERQHDALEVGLHQQKFGGELHAIAVGQRTILGLPTGFGQQLCRFRHVLAGIVRRGVDRVLPFAGEYLGRNLRLDLLEDLELAAARQATGLQFRIVEVTAEPDVLIIKQVLVDPFKVESKVEGTPYARVLKLRAADVEDKCLHRRHAGDRQRFELDQAALDGIEIEGRGPGLGAAFAPKIQLVCLEGLKRRDAIAEVDVLDFLEVPLALGDRQILGPPVLHALKANRAASVDFLDAVGARAERDLQRRFTEVTWLAVAGGAFPEMLGQHRQLADDHR